LGAARDAVYQGFAANSVGRLSFAHKVFGLLRSRGGQFPAALAVSLNESAPDKVPQVCVRLRGGSVQYLRCGENGFSSIVSPPDIPARGLIYNVTLTF